MVTVTTAKYKHASSILLERLKDGRYPVGGRMPTEDELAPVSYTHLTLPTNREV